MPLSLLEAMAYGRACVTSDIPECADVMAGNGLTFPKGDASALRKALAGLLSDPVRTTSLGSAARGRVEKAYDWDSVVQRTLELYGGETS